MEIEIRDRKTKVVNTEVVLSIDGEIHTYTTGDVYNFSMEFFEGGEELIVRTRKGVLDLSNHPKVFSELIQLKV